MPLDDEYSRVEAIRALAGADCTELEEELLGAVRDCSSEVRRAALAVLWEWQGSECEGVFLSAMEDEDREVRKVAAEHLLLLGSDEACLAAVRLLRKSGQPEDALLLVSALYSEWYEVRDAAARALVSLGCPECIEPLLGLAGNRGCDASSRTAAILVLGSFDRTEALDGLGALA